MILCYPKFTESFVFDSWQLKSTDVIRLCISESIKDEESSGRDRFSARTGKANV